MIQGKRVGPKELGELIEALKEQLPLGAKLAAGSFLTLDNALKLQERLRDKGIEIITIGD